MGLPRRALLMSTIAAAAASTIPRSLMAAPMIAVPSDPANRRFSLLYKGDTIGRHLVRSAAAVEEIRVNTEVEMNVKRFSFTVLSYSHRSVESWRDGRLVALKSEITEGGETFRVAGAAVPTGFRVIGKDGPFIAPAAVVSLEVPR
jgi:hypothetical protein